MNPPYSTENIARLTAGWDPAEAELHTLMFELINEDYTRGCKGEPFSWPAPELTQQDFAEALGRAVAELDQRLVWFIHRWREVALIAYEQGQTERTADLLE